MRAWMSDQEGAVKGTIGLAQANLIQRGDGVGFVEAQQLVHVLLGHFA